MKKFIKNNLKVFVAIILTAIICIGGTVFATVQFQASEVGYKTTTVDKALDNLYDNLNKRIPETLTLKLSVTAYNTTLTTGNYYLTPFKDYFNYFKLINKETNEYVNECKPRFFLDSNYNDLDINNQYSIDNIDDFWINVKSNTASNAAKCTFDLVLYN